MRAFPLVLSTFAIGLLVQEHQTEVCVQVLSSRILISQTMGRVLLPQLVSPFLLDRFCLHQTNLMLLRRQQKVPIGSPSAKKCTDISTSAVQKQMVLVTSRLHLFAFKKSRICFCSPQSLCSLHLIHLRRMHQGSATAKDN